jgi:hypothetical protein
MNRLGKLAQMARRGWGVLRLAVKKFLRIDGAQWAGAFAFNASTGTTVGKKPLVACHIRRIEP